MFFTDDYIYVWKFLYHIFFSAFMLESSSFFMDSTSSTFTTRSLIEGGPICNVSMYFHPMINSQTFTNRSLCKALVNNSVSIFSVLQYEIDMLLLSIWSFTKDTVYWCALSSWCMIYSHSLQFLLHFGHIGIIFSVWWRICGFPQIEIQHCCMVGSLLHGLLWPQ